jgi:adenosine deaminase
MPVLSQIPKVVLHEHLDGSVLPATVWELADQQGVASILRTKGHLHDMLVAPAGGDLPRYLRCFDAPLAVLQDEGSLERVAWELCQQWSIDSVVFGEVRFAPELHTRAGLSVEAACLAVLRGLQQGSVPARLIVTAMRNGARADEVASAAVALADRGVTGFDLAGPESGHPLQRHAGAISAAASAGLGITLHAGEALGPEAVVAALELGANRIGHGVRAVEDPALVARLAAEGVVLEVCVTSNVQTGAAPSVLQHQVDVLCKAGVRVSLQVDNRTVSATTLTREYELVAGAFGWGMGEFEAMYDRSLEAAFLSAEERRSLSRRGAP